MAKIATLKGKNGDVYPGTIPQAVIDPSTKKTLRKELDDLYMESVVMEEDSSGVEPPVVVAADTATKALQDWDGNDIRTAYLKDAPKDGNQYTRKGGAWVKAEQVTVDSTMNNSSTNPVQNKVVKSYIDGLFDVVTEAEYAALGNAVNSNGVIYFITE